jgi:hypothetical protein
MKKKLALALTATALAASPFAAAPAQATHLCAIWAPPYDQVFCTVVNVLCSRPLPPLTICR